MMPDGRRLGLLRHLHHLMRDRLRLVFLQDLDAAEEDMRRLHEETAYRFSPEGYREVYKEYAAAYEREYGTPPPPEMAP